VKLGYAVQVAPEQISEEKMLMQTDERYAAIAARKLAKNFFYAVITTGVYCRPDCGARLPRPENVRFFSSTAEARAAGFRACKRCKPDAPPPAVTNAALVADACRRIESDETAPSLKNLAASAGLSAFHFHRVFKDVTGVTPKEYAAAHRAARVQAALRGGGSVTEAIYDSGYPSGARFYATSDARLGMTPKKFRAGGAGEKIRYATTACSFGFVLVAATAKGICAISLGADAAALEAEFFGRFPKADVRPGDAGFAATVAAVAAFVDAPGKTFLLPLDIRGTAFQQRVWAALREIPPGKTASYARIAETIGAPAAVRAVGSACAANTLAVAIPCHRAVRRDGGLAGYRWGLEAKRALLERESADALKPAR
jgi:AraC family transcriptional regulator of adaptative response/methylated-DNA-[protein]-cysteine methyltransferase